MTAFDFMAEHWLVTLLLALIAARLIYALAVLLITHKEPAE